MISARIEKDSITPSLNRLTTFILTYPRFIHSEFMTHRAISKNSSSSRAIPVNRTIENIEKNPVIPKQFNSNKPGMQAGGPIKDQFQAMQIWNHSKAYAIEFAKQLNKLNVHKEIVNRILEPYSLITVVASGTDWANFFALRYHADAQPEMQELAKTMYEAYTASNPKLLAPGEWHLPFIDDECLLETFANPDVTDLNDALVKRSVARCARVSYKLHDGTNSTLEKDLDLYNKLLSSIPKHCSPAEHPAMALPDMERIGNFQGFRQHRKFLPNENITEFKK
jgi:thymidylate synthase ThyX